MPISIYIPSNSARGFLFSTLSPAFIFVVFFFFLMMAILTDMRGYLNAVLICFYLIICDVHLFIYLLAFFITSLEKCLSRSSAHILIGLFFLILSCVSCLYILEMILLPVVSLANIFSHSESCLFVVSFAVQKFLSLIRVLFMYFCFCCH